MNLSPKWIPLLKKAGLEAIHWSSVGHSNAPDYEILEYAKANGYVIFTHDLDFGDLLAAGKMACPSVIQIRTQDVTPDNLGRLVVSAIHQFTNQLEKGALITVDEKKLRARILPINNVPHIHS
ncbi:DUF5615 family PIN-like protein [Desulfosarcina sp. BuS5]|nr:DUF5615 family PIN-like protein [Desulfosarcina sp. BuS5]